MFNRGQAPFLATHLVTSAIFKMVILLSTDEISSVSRAVDLCVAMPPFGLGTFVELSCVVYAGGSVGVAVVAWASSWEREGRCGRFCLVVFGSAILDFPAVSRPSSQAPVNVSSPIGGPYTSGGRPASSFVKADIRGYLGHSHVGTYFDFSVVFPPVP